MATTTTHQRLVKPDPSESGKTTSYNADMDALEKGYHVRRLAGEAVTQFDALYYDGSTDRWRKALDATVGVRGICQVTAASGALTYVQVQGIVTNGAWAWTAGQEIFINSVTAGALTATAPFATSRPIGIALSATEIFLYEFGHTERLRRGLRYTVGQTLQLVSTNSGVFHQNIQLFNSGGQTLLSLDHSAGAEGAHATLAAESLIGGVIFRASDGTAFQSGVTLRAAVTEVWSGTARGCRLEFYVVKNTTTGQIEALRLDQDGRIRMFFSVSMEGDLTPSSLSASQNDYNPTNLADASCIRQASSVAVNITGLAGGANGRIITIMNINTAATAITLTAEDVASAAANRFDFAANVVLAAREAITMRYDATLSRWRSIGGKG